MDYEKFLKDLSTNEMDRRSFMATSGKAVFAAAIGLTLPYSLKTKGVEASATFTDYPFTLGVASGDPLPDGVVLWTRLAPNPLAADGKGGMNDKNIQVEWEVAEDPQFSKVVKKGTEVAMPELAHSVHAEVHGLNSAHEYFYRFRCGEEISPVGKTKTAPPAGSRLEQLSFAFASCQYWLGGQYAAYRNLAEEELDFVVHLGDYIYEKGNTETLADFRNRHALYKTSKDLQKAHAQFPFIVTFDDHEIENNWADEYSQADGEKSNENFLAFRARAFQAYYEHLPLRLRSKPHKSNIQLYRKFTFGDLAEFNVMDTRQYRDDQVGSGFPGGPLDPKADDLSRTMTGSKQEKWLYQNLEQSRARWNVLAQQTIMAHFDYDTSNGVSVNHDQWDGYIAERERILNFIKNTRPSNPVVISGDWHSSWVNDLKEDFKNPDSETLATEFVGTSISSGCGWSGDVESALSENPHVKFFNGDLRGYVRCKVTQNSWQSDYRVVSAPDSPNAKAYTMTSWVVKNDQPGAKEIGVSKENKVGAFVK